jgi:hypothetical protein
VRNSDDDDDDDDDDNNNNNNNVCRHRQTDLHAAAVHPVRSRGAVAKLYLCFHNNY